MEKYNRLTGTRVAREMLSSYLAMFGYFKPAQKVLHDDTISHYYHMLIRAVESRGDYVLQDKKDAVLSKLKLLKEYY